MRILIVLLSLACSVPAETVRSHKAIRDFRKVNPCPSTGLTIDSCPTHVIDHIIPLCLCQHVTKCLQVLDKPENMAWQAIDEAHKKDRIEVNACRAVMPPKQVTPQ